MAFFIKLGLLREGLKKNWNFPVLGGELSDEGSIYQFLKPSLIFARFSTIFGGFLSAIFQFSGGGGGGSDQNWKIPVFF